MVKKILIAEDELLVALALKKVIESWGYEVCNISKSGKDTIKIALDQNPDLLLVDIYLEDDIDGIDAVNEIHKHRQIPVVYVTASTDSFTYSKAGQSAMIKYLKKPYRWEELLATIKSV